MRDDQIREIIKRLFYLPVFLFIISFVIFWVARVVPGDPALIRAGPRASPETVESIRHELGLDRPILIQYKDYMLGLARGDLGKSIIYPDQNVGDLIWPRIQMSVPIGLTAFVISLFLGVIIGLLAAIKKGWFDAGFIGTLLLFDAIPILITIQFLILIFAVRFHLLPPSWSGGWQGIFSLKMIIPVFTLSLASIGSIARYVRTLTMNVLNQEYVLVAEASGFSFWAVSLKYILRNSLLPLVTVVIPAFFTVITGAFFVEKIYGIQGMGVFMVDVAFQRDYDVLTSMTIITAVLFVAANLIADVVYTVIDPRVRLARQTR